MRVGLKGDKYDLLWNEYESIEKGETYMLIIYVKVSNWASFLYKKTNYKYKLNTCYRNTKNIRKLYQSFLVFINISCLSVLTLITYQAQHILKRIKNKTNSNQWKAGLSETVEMRKRVKKFY